MICIRCGSDEVRPVTRFGRPLGAEVQCLACHRRFTPDIYVGGVAGIPSAAHIEPAPQVERHAAGLPAPIDVGNFPAPAPDPDAAVRAKLCVKCGNTRIDRQGRECRYCSWQQPDPVADIASKWHKTAVAKKAHGPAMYQAVREAFAAGLAQGRDDGARELDVADKALAGALSNLDQWRVYHKHCRNCGSVLMPTNQVVADGCPCNSGRGINHGLVAATVCTCAVCDPAQTGSSRFTADAIARRGKEGA